jgi:hypothetical protein
VEGIFHSTVLFLLRRYEDCEKTGLQGTLSALN